MNEHRWAYPVGLAIALGASFLPFDVKGTAQIATTPEPVAQRANGHDSIPAMPIMAASKPEAIAGIDAASSPGAQFHSISPIVDWNTYPGTLQSQTSRALDKRDGEMAADLANKLNECEITSLIMSTPETGAAPAHRDVAAQAERVKQIQEYQRILANCQTVGGDIRQLRARLLDVAVENNIVGAAIQSFYLGTRSAVVLQLTARDAILGEVSSLIAVAAHKPSTFGIDAESQKAIRYALELGSVDATVGHRVPFYRSLAESSSVYLADEKSPKFDHSNLSEASRSQGRAIADRMLTKLQGRSH